MKNDFNEISRKYNGEIIVIERLEAKAGEALHLRITVNAPSHYLGNYGDINPKPCNKISFSIICYPGYPLTAVKAFYPSDHYLASPNVFSSGIACIDTWIPFKSSLLTVTEKLVHDCIHDPTVTRYDSMANSAMKEWHKNGVNSKDFPTIPPQKLYATLTPPLPRRRPNDKVSIFVPLPKRKHQ